MRRLRLKRLHDPLRWKIAQCLADRTDVEPMTMVRILDRVEADGLLEWRPDPAERRARYPYLTRKTKPLRGVRIKTRPCEWS
jgi:DNA-binding MarR family transcriptional regulator